MKTAILIYCLKVLLIFVVMFMFGKFLAWITFMWWYQAICTGIVSLIIAVSVSLYVSKRFF